MTTVCNAPKCGKPIAQSPGHRERKYCDAVCRNRAARARKDTTATPATVPADPAPAPDTSLVDAVKAELEHANRLHTVDGQLAVLMASRMASGGTTASSVASLAKELNAVRARALAGTKPADPDALDEFTRRLREKAASA